MFLTLIAALSSTNFNHQNGAVPIIAIDKKAVEIIPLTRVRNPVTPNCQEFLPSMNPSTHFDINYSNTIFSNKNNTPSYTQIFQHQ
jgi:hypothetical protein